MLTCLAWLAAALLVLHAEPESSVPEPDAAWDAVFTRGEGWNGGDIAHSIDLGGRTLWLFGDSFVGPAREGKRAGSTMVRNAVALHATPERGEAPAEIAFFAGPAAAGKPASNFLDPDRTRWPEEAWFWLMGDGAVVGTGAERRLVLFATVVGPSGHPEGMWNFRRIGGAILTIRNFAEPADAWAFEQAANPIVQPQARHGEEPRPAMNWGAAVLPGEHGEWFIYGVRNRADHMHELILARCDADELDRPGAWVFFDGAGWVKGAGSAAALRRGITDEFTIGRVEVEGRPVLILIHSQPFLGRHVLASAAARPEGPWGEPVRLFEVPIEDRRLITYAARGHAGLSRPGELLVTYVVNSTDFWHVVGDATLYRPRFVRVPATLLPRP